MPGLWKSCPKPLIFTKKSSATQTRYRKLSAVETTWLPKLLNLLVNPAAIRIRYSGKEPINHPSRRKCDETITVFE